MTSLRSQEQIDAIKKYESDPFQLLNIISKDDVEHLLSVFYDNEKEQKATGPEVCFLDHNDLVLKKIVAMLEDSIGKFNFRAVQFFKANRPHILHIDDDFHYPNTYKAILIPLWHNGHTDPNFFIYNQHYYGGPAKFFKGRKVDPAVHYNLPVTDYKEIDGIDKIGIPGPVREKIDHLKDEWLEGLSVKAYFPWIVTSAIVFDSLQLHSAGNFLKQGVTEKIGLSIFTQDPQ